MSDSPKIDWDKPIMTVDGDPAKLISRDYRLSSGTLLYVVQVEHKRHSSLHYCCPFGHSVEGFNIRFIRNKIKKVVKWYNVYKSGPSCYYETEQKARSEIYDEATYVVTRSVEFEIT